MRWTGEKMVYFYSTSAVPTGYDEEGVCIRDAPSFAFRLLSWTIERLVSRAPSNRWRWHWVRTWHRLSSLHTQEQYNVYTEWYHASYAKIVVTDLSRYLPRPRELHDGSRVQNGCNYQNRIPVYLFKSSLHSTWVQPNQPIYNQNP